MVRRPFGGDWKKSPVEARGRGLPPMSSLLANAAQIYRYQRLLASALLTSEIHSLVKDFSFHIELSDCLVDGAGSVWTV